MQQLFRSLLGGEQSNPYGGTVSYEQARAKDPGLDFNTYHQKEDKWRDYSGKRNQLMQYLMTKGYSLEDMGLQNKQEFGKHDFDMYGKGGQSTQAGQGLDPAFQYDWASGTKRNTMTSDVNSPTVAISPQEMAAHKQSQDLASKGYDTYASQRWAANKMAHGKQLAPGAQPQHEKLNLDALAQRFGVDPSTLNSQFGQFGGANRPGWGAPAGGTPAGGLTPPPTDVTSAIQNGGNNTSGAPGNVSSIPQASTGQGQGGPNPYASMPNTPQGGFGGGGSNMSGSTGPSFMAPRYSPGGMGQRQGRGSIMGLGNQKGNNMSGSMPGSSGGF
jgi:AraC-like DNA-binding protein